MTDVNSPVSMQATVTVEACAAQLGRILRSADFDATARARRFLTYVVEETLAGRAGRIKAYTIAVEVFGRDASFDPQSDPIVRIEAGHLRRSLERYYLTGGLGDPVVISIPKGAYVPKFTERDTDAASPEKGILPIRATSSPRHRTFAIGAICLAVLVLIILMVSLRGGPDSRTDSPSIPRIMVEPFEDLAGTEESAAIANGLKHEIVDNLSRFRDIVIVQSLDNARVEPRYLLSGTIGLAGRQLRLQAMFTDRHDGTVLWANSYDGRLDVAEVLEVQAELARDIATSLAESDGVIVQSALASRTPQYSYDWDAYACTLSYYSYRVDIDSETRAQVRRCLEKSVERFPDYSTAWALLALVAFDDVRFQFPADGRSSEGALERALEMARLAVKLDPRNTRALQAEMTLLFYMGEFDLGRSVGEKALAINPNDLDVMGGFGRRLALSGEWDEGCSLVEQARERTLGSFGSSESALALCAFFRRDFDEAALWIKTGASPKNPVYHLMAAAIFGAGGMAAEAQNERAWLEANAPELVENFRREVSRRLARPEDVEFFLEGLRSAGFDIPR